MAWQQAIVYAKTMKDSTIQRKTIQIIKDYLDQSDWKVRENSNMSYSLQGLNHHISSSITSEYWLHSIYPEEVSEAHRTGGFHIHDLQVLAPYCCGWDLQDLLASGFRGVSGKMESRPAKHFRVALGQIVNFFFTLQGEAAGAQALSNFDTYLAPFVRYDKLKYADVQQALQEFIFNLNVPTRVGFQTPFTNLTFDVHVPSILADDKVVVGGEAKPETYKDFQKEMDMINRAFCEVMEEGDAQGRVFTFPIPTYSITKDFDWDNDLYETLWRMTAKYGIPYFSNFVNSDMSPEDARSMCCRLRLDNRHLRKRGGGLFGANPLTGSIGVVTINMARLGYLSETKGDFFDHLFRLMDLARDSLEIKRRYIESFADRGLFPYCRFYLRGVKERFGAYWKNHFSTIGINGMNEACINLLNKNIASDEGRTFAADVLDRMNERLLRYQEESDTLFNLEATPAEGTGYRFARIDKKDFPGITVANEQAFLNDAAPYYTNSTHLPVNYTDDIFTALDLQDELQTKYTGGTVLHGFIGEQMPSPSAVKNLVRNIAHNYHLPYFTLTPTFSICPNHGYLAGEHYYCPKCDAEIKKSDGALDENAQEQINEDTIEYVTVG